MQLHERLASSPAGDQADRGRDPFAALKNRIHLGVIEDLGRQIFTEDIAAADLVLKASSRLLAPNNVFVVSTID